MKTYDSARQEAETTTYDRSRVSLLFRATHHERHPLIAKPLTPFAFSGRAGDLYVQNSMCIVLENPFLSVLPSHVTPAQLRRWCLN